MGAVGASGVCRMHVVMRAVVLLNSRLLECLDTVHKTHVYTFKSVDSTRCGLDEVLI